MENLTLEELNLIRIWYSYYSYAANASPADHALIEKIIQAIDDKELTKNDLNF